MKNQKPKQLWGVKQQSGAHWGLVLSLILLYKWPKIVREENLHINQIHRWFSEASKKAETIDKPPYKLEFREKRSIQGKNATLIQVKFFCGLREG